MPFGPYCPNGGFTIPVMPNDSDPDCPTESGFNKQNDNSVRS